MVSETNATQSGEKSSGRRAGRHKLTVSDERKGAK